MPIDRSLRWIPVKDSYHLLAAMLRDPREEYLLFITQAAWRRLAELTHAAAERPEPEAGDPGAACAGFLVGQLCTDPSTQTRYGIITTIVALPAGAVAVEQDELTDESWRVMADELSRAPRSVLGWYRTRLGLESQLAGRDADAHLALFPNPWQVCAVVDPEADAPVGAFFIFESKVHRSYAVPFHEVFEIQPRGGGSSHSVVNWRNYSPEHAALPTDDLADDEVDEPPVRTASTSRRSQPVALRPSQRQQSRESHEAPAGGKGTDGRRRTPSESPPVVTAIKGAVSDARKWLSERPSSHRAAPRDYAPEDVPVAPDLKDPLAVVLPPAFHRSARRTPSRSTIGLFAAIALFAIVSGVGFVARWGIAATRGAPPPVVRRDPAVPAPVVPAPVPDTSASATPTVREPRVAVADSPVAAPSTAAAPSSTLAAPAPPDTASPSDPARPMSAFDAHSDSLEIALTLYRGAAESVAMRNPSCEAYLRWYDVATTQFVSMSDAYRLAGAGVDVERSMRFNKLASDVSDMDRDYRRSPCRRR